MLLNLFNGVYLIVKYCVLKISELCRKKTRFQSLTRYSKKKRLKGIGPINLKLLVHANSFENNVGFDSDEVASFFGVPWEGERGGGAGAIIIMILNVMVRIKNFFYILKFFMPQIYNYKLPFS